ncbi:MAG: 6-hydroxymethylpterin diphosphokinase MptE-like protein [Phycisphaerae bacterium]
MSTFAAIPAELIPLRDCYLRNLEALYSVNPPLADAIDKTPFAACPALERGTADALTAQRTSDNGSLIYLHSRRAPRDEAQRLIDAQKRDPSGNSGHSGTALTAAESEEPDNVLTFILFGIGLGYHVGAIESSFQGPTLIVCEPRLEMIKAAMCVQNFAPQLAANRLVFLTQNDAASVAQRLKPLQTLLMLGTRLIVPAYSRRVDARFHDGIRRKILDFVAHTRTQFVTLLKNARLTFRNVAFNLPHYLANAGIDAFSSAAAGLPAVVVSAGPSLSAHIADLARIQNRVVIIATQTVLRPLLNAGITPHFVTSLDYHEISRQYFANLPADTPCVLIAEPKVTPAVPDNFPGRMHMLHSPVADQLLRDAAPQRAKLSAGSTVAHLAFYVAQHLDCDPIFFVGQDLAYSDGLYYAAGMPIEDIWAPELSRFETIEKKQWERIARMRPILKTVSGVNGNPVHTDDPMFSYLQQFEADFRDAPQRIILAGHSGAAIAGSARMSFPEFEATLVPKDPHGIDFASLSQREENAARDTSIHQLRERCAETDAIRVISEETIRVLEDLTLLLDDSRRFNAKLADLDKLRADILRYDAMYKVIVSVSQRAELRRIDADRRIGGENDAVEDAATARRRLRRDIAFVRELLDGCGFVDETLRATIARLTEGVS